MENAAKITYTKLRDGSWGIRGPVDVVKQGAIVAVEKRSGETKSEIVSRVVWSGEGIALASVAAQSQQARSSRSYSRGGRRSGGGCHTDGNCSSCCDPSTCPCGDGSWFRCC